MEGDEVYAICAVTLVAKITKTETRWLSNTMSVFEHSTAVLRRFRGTATSFLYTVQPQKALPYKAAT